MVRIIKENKFKGLIEKKNCSTLFILGRPNVQALKYIYIHINISFKY